VTLLSGLGFLAVEYPGFGISSGMPSEAAMIEASEAMVTHLVQSLKVNEDSVVLFGQSIGCVPALALAAKGFGVKSILVSPFTSVPKLATEIWPFLKPALWIFPGLIRDPCGKHLVLPALQPLWGEFNCLSLLWYSV